MLPETLYELLSRQSSQRPLATAIEAPGQPPLTYRRLFEHVQAVGMRLQGLGVKPNDRVAIVLPQSAEMAVAFLAVSAVATSAPLNPDFRENEFEFYLEDLAAKILIVQKDADSPARTVAHKQNIPVIEITRCENDGAGIFSFFGDHTVTDFESASFSRDDIALILHTSGTTSKPKMVPLSNANLLCSARNIQAALKLDANDRGFNVMPLFHIHGLIGSVLSSIVAGGTVICGPRFNAAQFFSGLSIFQPTWYTAVPTMHLAVLGEAAANASVVASSSLRLLRSSSAAMPPQLMNRLEETFGAPVIEAYGMTEAAHQICSNPLPPRNRKPGSVGLAAGPEVGVMSEEGKLLPAETVGEIVLRGANIFRGYDHNPEANRTTFAGDWFRTGDQGYLDSEGYLFITGRIKELINRGGQKISPREIDEVLLDHPDVEQAVCFAAPHPTLGEDIAAAVVLRENVVTTERSLRDFLAHRLAEYKIPRQLIFLDEVPKGPTGKIQRIGLAEKLSGHFKKQLIAPRNAREESLVTIWRQVLGLKEIGIKDNFFELGGDSLSAARLMLEIEREFEERYPINVLLQLPTIEEFTELLSGGSHKILSSCLVPIQPNGSKPPLFCVHAHEGNVMFYRDLSNRLGPNQPFYAFQARGLDGKEPPFTRLEDMAAHYVRELMRFQPKGPYSLGGSCMGGMIAFEMARQIHTLNGEVALLVLFNTNGPGYPKPLPTRILIRASMTRHLREVSSLPLGETLKLTVQKAVIRLKLLRTQAKKRVFGLYWKRSLDSGAGPAHFLTVSEINTQVLNDYVPKPYSGKMVLFRPVTDPPGCYPDPTMGWNGLALGGIEVHTVPAEGTGVMYSSVMVEDLKALLASASARA